MHLTRPLSARRIALVTGTAGYVAGWVARTLLQDGWDVRGLDVAVHPPGHIEGEGFEPLRGDVRDHDVVAKSARGVSAVFHLAMLDGSGRESAEEVVSLALDGLDAVLAAVREEGVRLVYTSSAAAVGETDDPGRPCDEDDWNDLAVTPYQRAKVEAERRLWERAADVDAVAVLPGMAIGPRDPTGTPSNARIEQMYRRARLPIWFGGGLNAVDVRDVARGHVLAFEKGTRGRRYILGGTNLTFRELLETVRVRRGLRGAPPFRLPDGPLLATVGAYERVVRAAGKRPIVTKVQLEKRLRRYLYLSNERARRELGFTPRPLVASIRDLLDWSLDTGRLPASLPRPV